MWFLKKQTALNEDEDEKDLNIVDVAPYTVEITNFDSENADDEEVSKPMVLEDIAYDASLDRRINQAIENRISNSVIRTTHEFKEFPPAPGISPDVHDPCKVPTNTNFLSATLHGKSRDSVNMDDIMTVIDIYNTEDETDDAIDDTVQIDNICLEMVMTNSEKQIPVFSVNEQISDNFFAASAIMPLQAKNSNISASSHTMIIINQPSFTSCGGSSTSTCSDVDIERVGRMEMKMIEEEIADVEQYIDNDSDDELPDAIPIVKLINDSSLELGSFPHSSFKTTRSVPVQVYISI